MSGPVPGFGCLAPCSADLSQILIATIGERFATFAANLPKKLDAIFSLNRIPSSLAWGSFLFGHCIFSPLLLLRPTATTQKSNRNLFIL